MKDVNVILSEEAMIPVLSFEQLHAYGYRCDDIQSYNNLYDRFKSGHPVRLCVHYSCIVGERDTINLANVHQVF